MITLTEFIRTFLSFLLVIMLLVILSYVLCIWMLLHAIKKENAFWIVILAASLFTVFLPGIAGIVYYFAIYRKSK